MKAISSVWLIVSLFVMPCTLNIERIGICLFVLANIVLSFLLFRKHNPEYINH